MFTQHGQESDNERARPARAALAVVMLAVLVACAEEPLPRSFAVFMEDRIAREGTLARCNEDAEATLHDIECANARRAAAAIALRYERERREALERESERKLAALRDQIAAREQAAREAALAQAAAEREAYEAMWREQTAAAAAERAAEGGSAEPADGLSLIVPPKTPPLRPTVDAEQTPAPEPQDLERLSQPRPFRSID